MFITPQMYSWAWSGLIRHDLQIHLTSIFPFLISPCHIPMSIDCFNKPVCFSQSLGKGRKPSWKVLSCRSLSFCQGFLLVIQAALREYCWTSCTMASQFNTGTFRDVFALLRLCTNLFWWISAVCRGKKRILIQKQIIIFLINCLPTWCQRDRCLSLTQLRQPAFICYWQKYFCV